MASSELVTPQSTFSTRVFGEPAVTLRFVRLIGMSAQTWGVPEDVNYTADHKQFRGLIIATRRRMVPSDPDGPRRHGSKQLRRIDRFRFGMDHKELFLFNAQ